MGRGFCRTVDMFEDVSELMVQSNKHDWAIKIAADAADSKTEGELDPDLVGKNPGQVKHIEQRSVFSCLTQVR